MSVEKGFFETIDDVLAEKTNLRLQLPEVTNFYKFIITLDIVNSTSLASFWYGVKLDILRS